MAMFGTSFLLRSSTLVIGSVACVYSQLLIVARS